MHPSASLISASMFDVRLEELRRHISSFWFSPISPTNEFTTWSPSNQDRIAVETNFSQPRAKGNLRFLSSHLASKSAFQRTIEAVFLSFILFSFATIYFSSIDRFLDTERWGGRSWCISRMLWATAMPKARSCHFGLFASDFYSQTRKQRWTGNEIHESSPSSAFILMSCRKSIQSLRLVSSPLILI